MLNYIKNIIKRGSFEFAGNSVMYIINSVDNMMWFRLSDICSAINVTDWCNPKHKNYLMGKGKLDNKRRILFTQSKVYAWGINEEDVVWLLEEYAETNSTRAECTSRLLNIIKKFIEREKGAEMKVEEPKETNNVSSNKEELTDFPGIFNYNGNNITFKTVNNTVMVNATEMAKGFDKRFPDWIRLKSTKEFLYVLSTIKNKNNSRRADLHDGIQYVSYKELKFVMSGAKENHSLILISQGGQAQGTWMHEDVALEFARWLAPEFAIWCNDKIKELITTGTTSLYNNVNFGGFPTPQKFSDALLLSAHLQQKVEEQEAKIEEDKPKVEYYSGMVENRDYFTTTTIATELRTTSKILNQFLCKKGVLIGKSGSWKVTDEYQTLLSPSPLKSIIRWNHEGRTLIHQLWEERVEELVEA